MLASSYDGWASQSVSAALPEKACRQPVTWRVLVAAPFVASRADRSPSKSCDLQARDVHEGDESMD